MTVASLHCIWHAFVRPNVLSDLAFSLLLIHLPPRSTLFPYTTLFRSLGVQAFGRSGVQGATNDQRPTTKDRKSTRLNSSHANISYAVFCLKKKTRHVHSHARDGESVEYDDGRYRRRYDDDADIHVGGS